jgi:hypothetical protein
MTLSVFDYRRKDESSSNGLDPGNIKLLWQSTMLCQLGEQQDNRGY